MCMMILVKPKGSDLLGDIFVECSIIEEYRQPGSDGRNKNDWFEVNIGEEYFRVKRKALYFDREPIVWEPYAEFQRGTWGLRLKNNEYGRITWVDDLPLSTRFTG